ncbi:MAG TPA: amidohydrolase family protein [Candidatus Agrococcus pullicola]|uniref:Amidohydrolase family protein n=1 Tax=Candidatus Agrococcus pullicola TaxID=2838429 RepID=A0A9D1YS78_9MICO|nr:amidohydrolase family protein [Candidatus Agrococcus pullicola]
MTASAARTRTAFVGGLVADGTGAGLQRADVLVSGETVEAIVPAEQRPRGGYDADTVDCTDRVVAPGFVDIHCHSDLSLIAYPGNDSRVGQGITTEVVGNCGMSPAPSGGDRAGLRRVISTIDVVPGLDWDWAEVDGWRAALENTPIATNVALQIGHGAARFAVAGEAGISITGAELDRIESELHRAMEAGCVGVSLGLMYAPGEGAAAEELARVAQVVARHDGVLSVHMRDYRAASLISAIEEVARPARDAGARVQISHLRSIGEGTSFRDVLSHIEKLRREQDIAADAYPYVHGHTTLLQLLPSEIRAQGPSAILAAAEADTTGVASMFRASGYEPDAIIVMKAAARPAAAGVSLSDVDEDPWVWLTSLLVDCSGDVDVAVESGNWADVDLAMRTPWISIASDGTALGYEHRASVAHPRSWGAFPAAYRRMRDAGVAAGEAVKRMTNGPAERARITARIEPGRRADITVFDDARFDSAATFAAPAAQATGLDHVMTGGSLVLHDGKRTTARPGEVLTKQTQEAAYV